MRIVIPAVIVFGLWAVPSLADDAAFKPLMVEPAVSKSDICRNGIVRHRIERWRAKDHVTSQPQVFGSVDDIVKDVMPDALQALQEKGCNPAYIWGFLACTGLDDPNFKSDRIIPRGVTAGSDREMAGIMKDCMADIAAAGVAPAL